MLAQNLFISPSTVAQHAALACFAPETIAILEERRAELDARRRFLVPALESLGIAVPVMPEGAFYVYADVSGVTRDSFAFARELLAEEGVALTPGKDFGRHEPERHVRIAYTQPVARLEEAAGRIRPFPVEGEGLTMWLDAILAYLHFIAIFLLFSFLVVEAMMIRGPLDAAAVRLLGRVDIWFFGSAIAVLATGILRLAFGAKGAQFYLSAWPIYAKVGLFLAVGVISIAPTLRFIRWRKAFERDAVWSVPDAERRTVRRLIMVEVHLAALIPLLAVIMSRGLLR